MDELLAAAKNYLDITWEDQEGDKKLSGILEPGKTWTFLRGPVAASCCWTTPGTSGQGASRTSPGTFPWS